MECEICYGPATARLCSSCAGAVGVMAAAGWLLEENYFWSSAAPGVVIVYSLAWDSASAAAGQEGWSVMGPDDSTIPGLSAAGALLWPSGAPKMGPTGDLLFASPVAALSAFLSL